MGRFNSTRVDERKKGLKSSGHTNEKARTAVERGENGLVYDPGSELRLGGREKRGAKIINGMNKTKIKNKNKLYPYHASFYQSRLLGEVCSSSTIARSLRLFRRRPYRVARVSLDKAESS